MTEKESVLLVNTRNLECNREGYAGSLPSAVSHRIPNSWTSSFPSWINLNSKCRHEKAMAEKMLAWSRENSRANDCAPVTEESFSSPAPLHSHPSHHSKCRKQACSPATSSSSSSCANMKLLLSPCITHITSPLLHVPSCYAELLFNHHCRSVAPLVASILSPGGPCFYPSSAGKNSNCVFTGRFTSLLIGMTY